MAQSHDNLGVLWRNEERAFIPPSAILITHISTDPIQMDIMLYVEESNDLILLSSKKCGSFWSTAR